MIDVAKEYAEALFELAEEGGVTARIYEELTVLDDAVSAYPEYIMFLSSPSIQKAERLAAVEKICEGMHEYVRSFVSILTERGRMDEFHRCREKFNLLYDFAQKQIKAYVTSAVELSTEQKNKLKAKLEGISKHSVEMLYKVDKSLIAGITVNMDDTVIDGSLKRRLHNLKEVIEK